MLAPSTGDIAIAQSALERLAASFEPQDFTVTPTSEESGPPGLTVASRHCPLSDDVFVQGQFFWFAWGEPVGPVDDPVRAAAKISRVLRAVPEPSHG